MFKNKHSQPGVISMENPQSFVSEEFKTIRSNVQFSMIDYTFSSLMITSTGPGEGKSFVSANLSAAFAAQGAKVLLVDADMRSPSLNRLFHLPNKTGLTTLLRYPETRLMDVIYPVYQENLFFLPTGVLPPNPSELLASERMDQLMVQLEKEYDLVLYDMPPIVPVTDAQVMASKTDGTIFVVRRGVTNREKMLKAKQLLEYANANVIGTIFNGRKWNRWDKHYQYHYH